MRLLSYGLLLFGWLCWATALFGWLPFIDRNSRLDAIGVVVFLVLGAIAYGAGLLLEKLTKPYVPKTYVLKPGDKRFISMMLRGAARGQLLFGIALLAFDGGWLWLTLDEWPTVEERRTAPGYPMIAVVISLVFITIFALTALLSLYASFRMRSPLAGRIRRALVETPERLTSVTFRRIRKAEAPGDVGARFLAEIHVGADELALNLSKKHAALLKQYVERNAPGAKVSEVDVEV